MYQILLATMLFAVSINATAQLGDQRSGVPVLENGARPEYVADEAVELAIGSEWSLSYAYSYVDDSGNLVLKGEVENQLEERRLTPTFSVRLLDSAGDILLDNPIDPIFHAVDGLERSPFDGYLRIPEGVTENDIADWEIVSCGPITSDYGYEPSPITFAETSVSIDPETGRVRLSGMARLTGTGSFETGIVTASIYRSDGLYIGTITEHISTPLSHGQGIRLSTEVNMSPEFRGLEIDLEAPDLYAVMYAQSGGLLQTTCVEIPQPLPLVDPSTVSNRAGMIGSVEVDYPSLLFQRPIPML